MENEVMNNEVVESEIVGVEEGGNNASDFGKGALLVGIGAAAGIGIYKGVKWVAKKIRDKFKANKAKKEAEASADLAANEAALDEIRNCPFHEDFRE